jgi:hypothetical protein
MGGKPTDNVANALGFEWSSIVRRASGRGRNCRVEEGARNEGTSQFVTDKSGTIRSLMRVPRRVVTSMTDGGADGPARGSSCVASARIVRDDKVQSAASDRSLCTPRADPEAGTRASAERGCDATRAGSDDENGIGE